MGEGILENQVGLRKGWWIEKDGEEPSVGGVRKGKEYGFLTSSLEAEILNN